MQQVNDTLYKQTSKGAVQQWTVSVVLDVVIVSYGQVGGKFQTKSTTCTGKNIGKSNETTPEEQAVAEAISKWEKQVKKGYVTDPSGIRTINLPMKVESYFKGKMADKVKFPCTIGRKLNGVNGEARLTDTGMVHLSRGGEEYPLPYPAAQKELIRLMELIGTCSLNYEVYKHGYHLQDITGAVKAPKNHIGLWEQLEYHVFDLPTFGGDWSDRLAALRAVTEEFTYVKIVENEEVHSHAGIRLKQDQFVAEGFEGSVVRNYSGRYKYNTRTMDVLKVKYVISEEFKVDSYFADKNNHPVFWCESKGGLFKVKPKGTSEQRDNILSNAESWIGKWMTVEFETYSKDNKPLKPVGIGLREGVETNGIFEASV